MGSILGKRRFLIFDYCNNFEFFNTKPNGYEGTEVKILQENIYGKRIQLIAALQESSLQRKDTRNGERKWQKHAITRLQL